MNKTVLIAGSLVLVVLAIGMVAIIERTNTSNESANDVRARAAVTKNLELNGVIQSIQEQSGTLTVENVYFADSNRSGDAKDMGTWIVSVPVKFNFASVAPGGRVRISVDAKTFIAATRTMSATQITPIR